MIELVCSLSAYQNKTFARCSAQVFLGYNFGATFHANKGDGFKLHPKRCFSQEEAAIKDFIIVLNKAYVKTNMKYDKLKLNKT